MNVRLLTSKLAVALVCLLATTQLPAQTTGKKIDHKMVDAATTLDGKAVKLADSKQVNASQPATTSSDLANRGWRFDKDPNAEVVDKRDYTSKTFKNADGTYTAAISAGPIHYKKGDSYYDIDPQIVPNMTGNFALYPYVNSSNLMESYFPNRSSQGIVSVTGQGSVKEFVNTRMYWESNGTAINTVNSSNASVAINNNQATFTGLYPQIDAQYTISAGKRELNYIINNASAIAGAPANADYLVFAEDIEMDQTWSYTINRDGIAFVKNGSKSVYEYENPKLVEGYSNAAPSLADFAAVTMEVQRNGNTITILTKVKASWLQASNRVFPIAVDPTSSYYPDGVTYRTGQMLSSGSGAYGTIAVGYASGYYRGYASFDISSIPSGAAVTTTKLYVKVGSTTGMSTTRGSELRQFLTDPEDPTYSTWASLYNAVTNGTNSPSIYTTAVPLNSTGFKNYTLGTQANTDVQNALSSGKFTVGFRPSGTYSGTNQYCLFYGDDATSSANLPYVSITYTANNPPVCASYVAPSNGITYGAPNANLIWNSASGATSYDVYFGSSPSPSLATNTTDLYYSPGCLTPGTTYYWKVVPKNAYGSATGCDTWSFTADTMIALYVQNFDGWSAGSFPTSANTGSDGWYTNSNAYQSSPYGNIWTVQNDANGISGNSIGVSAIYNGSVVSGGAFNYYDDLYTNRYILNNSLSTAGYKDVTITFKWKAGGETSPNDYGQLIYTPDGTNILYVPEGGTDGVGDYYNQGTTATANVLMPTDAENNANFQFGYLWTNDDNNLGAGSLVVDDIEVKGCPMGGDITPLTSSFTGSGSASFTLNNVPSACALKQWQTAPSASGPWTDIAGATATTYNTPTVTSTTYYRCKVYFGTCDPSYQTTPSVVYINPANAPDLVVQSITPSNSNICGAGTVNYDVTIKNQGNVAINNGTSFSVAAYSGAACGGTALASQSYSGGLAINGTTTLTIAVPLTGSGVITTSFTADAANAITEQNEVNNCLSNSGVTLSNGLHGTYTIGGSSPDYATFGAAVSDLVSNGVCGPVVFNVRTGTYTETINITAITGVSATNTVTFQSETGTASDVTLQYASTNNVVNITSAYYLRFKNMTISDNYNNSSYVAFKLRDADYLEITGCTINASPNTSTAYSNAAVYFYDNTNPVSENVLMQNNIINGGATGIYQYGGSTYHPTNNTFDGNTLNNQIVRGIYTFYNDNVTITGNSISSTTTNTGYNGIEMDYGSVSNVSTNNLTLGTVKYGIYFNSASGTSGTPAIVANNFVSTGGAVGQSSCVYINGSSYLNLYFNSFNNNCSSNTIITSSVYFAGTITDASINLVNNIFAMSYGGSSQVCIYFASTNNVADINTWDYNDYYYAGSSSAAYIAAYKTLATLQSYTSKDAHSLNIDPQFTSNSDLHVSASGLQAGTSGTGITGDIDGQTRQSTPFMGADEAIVCTPGTWTGTVSTDWFTTGNWSCNTVPTASTNVTIPTGLTNYPEVSGGVGQTATVSSVTIETGASVTVLGVNGVGLEIHGDLTNNGSPSFGAGKVTLKGTSAGQTITGANEFTDLEIDNSNGITIASGMQSISGVLGLKSGTLTTNNLLTLASDANGAATINDFTSGMNGSLSGDVAVQRYVVNPNNGFYYIGTPVGSATISQWGSEFGLAPINGATDGSQVIPTASCSLTQLASGSPYGNLFDYRESAVTSCILQGWHVRTAGAIVAGQGYAGRIPNGTMLSLKGAAGTGGKQTSALSSTASNGTNAKGFNLISNPYPSALDWSSVAAANSNIQGTAYLYQASGAYSGTYNPINALTGGGQIGSSQGFFVQAITNGAVVNFTNSMRTLGNNRALRSAPVYDEMLTMNVTGNGFGDRTILAFGRNFTNGFDRDYDARKLMSRAGQPSIYTGMDTGKMAINALETYVNVRTIPVGFDAGATGTFTITFQNLNTFDPTALVFFEDLKLHTLQNVLKDSTYTFVADANDDPNRFQLHFVPKAEVTATPQGCINEDGTILVDLGQYNVNNTTIVWDNLQLADQNGQIVQNINNASGVIALDNLADGSYYVNLNIGGYQVSLPVTVSTLSRVTANFTASATTVNVGDRVVFTDASTGAVNYDWDFGDGSSQIGAGSATHSYSMPGYYRATLMASNTDCRDAYTVGVTVLKTDNPTGVATIGEQELHVIGNNNQISLLMSNMQDANGQVDVYDVLGKRIVSVANVSFTQNRYDINLPTIARGYYLVKISSAHTNFTQKVFLGDDK